MRACWPPDAGMITRMNPNRLNESDWLAAGDPPAMLRFVRRRATDRKLRLFACACCRRVWDTLPDHECRAAVVAAERFADLEATRAEMAAAAARVTTWRPWQIPYRAAAAAWHAAADIPAGDAAHYAAYHSAEADEAPHEAVRLALGGLLKDVFGNPFRPVAFDPRWRSDPAVALASGMYSDRAFDCLPILADALEEAGCDHSDLLAHCRDYGPHVRGCWVIDQVLGRE